MPRRPGSGSRNHPDGSSLLNTLHIKNYALIEELAVGFESGLNIITGETGAGKSIIIDALSLVLGARAETDIIRKDAEKAIVEAIFSVTGNRKLKALLSAHELEMGEELILRREVSLKGQSRSFVNDTPVSLAVLKQVGELHVDLHGQHEHQSLLRTETHIEMLDDFGGLDGLVGEFRSRHEQANSLLRQRGELRSRERQLMELRELHEFQIREIDAVGPQAGEEERLEAELNILENAEKLFAATERLYQMLYEGENAVHDQLVLTRNELENLASIDSTFEEPRGEAASAAAIVDELAKFVQQYNSRIEFNPERLEEIRDRLGSLTMLKKKYGGTLDSLINHRRNIGKELELANNFQSEIAALEGQLERHRKECSVVAQRLSAKRHEVARKVNRAIVQALGELGIPNARFETMITSRHSPDAGNALIRNGNEYFEATPRGMDWVEFHLSTNAGEDVKPLARVASGGEISRVMLAMKMILAKSDRLPLLIFDEIDIGISGRIAQAVGMAMKKLSQFHQLIAITHLPQIAGFADAHFAVEKVEERNRSFSRLRKLSLDERVTEVARLMSGAEVTGSTIESARELMRLA